MAVTAWADSLISRNFYPGPDSLLCLGPETESLLHETHRALTEIRSIDADKMRLPPEANRSGYSLDASGSLEVTPVTNWLRYARATELDPVGIAINPSTCLRMGFVAQ